VAMECTVQCAFTDDFLKLNAKPDVLKADKRTEYIKVQSRPGRYLISQNAVYADKSQSGPSSMGFDGSYTYDLSGNVDRVLSVSKRKFTELSTSYLGYDALLFPYNFLFESSNSEWFAWQDIGTIQDPRLWKDFLTKQKPVIYQDAVLGELRFYQIKHPNYEESVSLSSRYNNLPVYYSRKDQNGKLVLAYYAKEVQKAPAPGAAFYYAPRAAILMYLSGWHVATYDLAISKLELNEELSDDLFEMDPSVATAVWDSDQKLYIEIPR
jgi:hypothetical protein